MPVTPGRPAASPTHPPGVAGPVWREPMARPHDLVVGHMGARFLGRTFACAIGHGGLRLIKCEGDLASPVGSWRLRRLYWRADRGRRPGGSLKAIPLDHRIGWSEAPCDPAYNTAVRTPHGFGHDRMHRGDPLYDICVVTDQNTAPVVPGHGSAIFVHIWRKPRHPTAGCVAFSRHDLEWILARWTKRSRLIIRPR